MLEVFVEAITGNDYVVNVNNYAELNLLREKTEFKRSGWRYLHLQKGLWNGTQINSLEDEYKLTDPQWWRTTGPT